MTSQGAPRRREPRTLLEQLIWERNQTLTEFVEWAEDFARRHNEPGTLSERNLKRLVAGQKPDGSPIGRPRPATSRLLERIFEYPINNLIALPPLPKNEGEEELRQRLLRFRRLDSSLISLLNQQLNTIREIDRRFGSIASQREVSSKARQVEHLLTYSMLPAIREDLAALLSEVESLAGWQALDRGRFVDAWKHYGRSRSAAYESQRSSFEVHATVGLAYVLLDLNEPRSAKNVIEPAVSKAKSSPHLLQSWTTAAYSEVLAANGMTNSSLRIFDEAEIIFDASNDRESRPYVAHDPVHLNRWRGSIHARLNLLDANQILISTLKSLDPTFSRARASLLVDLAQSQFNLNEEEQGHASLKDALTLAQSIGSIRQHSRATELAHTRIA